MLWQPPKSTRTATPLHYTTLFRSASIVRTVAAPFQHEGGMRILSGNIGRACIKISAVEEDRWTIEAPARVFSDQQQVQDAFKAGELDRDVIVVVRFQGPRANGMPELHKLTPPLGVLQDRKSTRLNSSH